MLLIVLAFLMGITRNAGIFVLIPTSKVLFLFSKGQFLKVSGTYFGLGSIGFIAWNIYAFYVQQGFEPIYNDDLFFGGGWQNLLNYFDVSTQWFLPAMVPLLPRIFLLLILIIWLLKIKKTRAGSVLGVRVFLLQFFIYTSIMVFFIDVDYDEIERLLSIVYPWCMIGVLLAIDQYWDDIKPEMGRGLQVCLVVWILYVVFGV